MSAHEYDIPTRFLDMDAFGHVNNGVYFSYLETARVFLYREPTEFGRPFWELFEGNQPLVSGNRIEYRTEIRFDPQHPLRVAVWCSRIGRTSHDIAFEITDHTGTVSHAVAESIIVQASSATGRPTPLSESQVAVLESWRGDPVPFR